MVHIIPVKDIYQHTLETCCECNPEIETDDGILVKHKSFDLREFAEGISGYKSKGWEVIDDSKLPS